VAGGTGTRGEEILRDFYRDTQVKVVTGGKDVEISWVGGTVDSQTVAPVSMSVMSVIRR